MRPPIIEENNRSRPKPPQPSRVGVDGMFRVFADQTRLRIIRLLQGGPLCVADLVQILRLPQPTVSRHLTYLRRAAFVSTTQYGLWVFYHLAAAQNPLHEKLLDCLATCDNMLPDATGDASRARNLRRAGGCCPEGRRLMREAEQRRFL